MAFRALLFSKSPETDAAMTAACKSTGIGAEVCSDIFSAIAKGTKRSYSCLIADWADQPEASFLLRRARESAPNRDTVAIAIVDHDPTPAELRDNRLDFLIYRPISDAEAAAVLAKASEQMQPLSAEDTESPGESDASNEVPSAVSADPDGSEHSQPDQAVNFQEENAAEGYDAGDSEREVEEPQERSHGTRLRSACAAVLVLVAVFCLWRSRDSIEYLARTPEGRYRILRESVVALFSLHQTDELPVATGSEAQQESYIRRATSGSNAQTPALEVVAAESTQIDTRLPLPKASDIPLPMPVFVHQDPPPVRVEHAAIPESMKNSPPIARPVVATVTPGQMMPVSAPQLQPAVQQFSEPVAVSEEAARALLVHTVDPVYPPEALAQKLQGPVVLQAVIGRSGNVEDLKIVRGYFVLGRAAIAAVKQWKFQPYSLNGQAAAMQTVITINFSYPPG
ncbi:MAG TPA: TonB family protein [Terriglobales bacterium]|nr:TonB family protein [Terriglobales bacterium]